MFLNDDINHSQISEMTLPQLKGLCRELRGCILRTTRKTGGHLSANLGTVELTVALHYVFDTAQDRILWDVGHQAYSHKLLTGRYSSFGSLRALGGIAGFPRRSECEADAFIAGHASTSVSAACGIATAMKLSGKKGSVAAVIGDGAFTGGMAYEGLNNAAKLKTGLVVVLNDNDMSISKSTGALARYLTNIRSTRKYYRAKENVRTALSRVPLVGDSIERNVRLAKNILKEAIYDNSTLFENLGYTYIGPVDGHNLEDMIEALSVAKLINRPCVVHVQTTKGKGYKPAEQNPGEFHAIAKKGSSKPALTYSEVFGTAMEQLGIHDKRICGITAAMKYATGMNYFAASCPERFFDAGIAEQHSVTFAAGLAVEGMLPVFAVYSTFLQRGYDQIIHDCAIENTHVTLAIDRAGFVGEDGETHQGVFDVAMLSSIPNTTIYSPASFRELTDCLSRALYETKGVAAVRYPKGGEYSVTLPVGMTTPNGSPISSSYAYSGKSSKTLAVSYGRIAAWLHEAAELCGADWLRLLMISPLPESAVKAAAKYDRIVFFEEGVISGGIGERLCAALRKRGYHGSYDIIGVDRFVPTATVDEQLAMFGLDKEGMVRRLR